MTILSLYIAVYVFFCVLVALAARNVAIGFWGVLVLSLLITPLLTVIFVLILKPKPKPKKKKRSTIDSLEEYY